MASDRAYSDYFGIVTDISSDESFIPVGANGDDDPDGRKIESVYIFELIDGTYVEKSKLNNDTGTGSEVIGSIVRLTGDGDFAFAVVYSKSNVGLSNGAIYIYD